MIVKTVFHIMVSKKMFLVVVFFWNPPSFLSVRNQKMIFEVLRRLRDVIISPTRPFALARLTPPLDVQLQQSPSLSSETTTGTETVITTAAAPSRIGRGASSARGYVCFAANVLVSVVFFFVRSVPFWWFRSV